MHIISIILTYGEEHKTLISALTAGTPGSIPVWGTKIPQAMLWGQKKSQANTQEDRKTQMLKKKLEQDINIPWWFGKSQEAELL